MEATLVWRSWSAPPLSDLRAWRLDDGTVLETPNPDAKPPSRAVAPVEPRGWDHDHCAFCWAKFIAPDRLAAHRESHDRHQLHVAGYTPETEESGRRTWICPTCFEDFRERFRWTVIGGS